MSRRGRRHGRMCLSNKLIFYHDPVVDDSRFRPIVVSTSSTTLCWKSEAGTSFTTGSVHSYDYYPIAGRRKCIMSIPGGLRNVGELSCPDDMITSIRNLHRAVNSYSFTVYNNRIPPSEIIRCLGKHPALWRISAYSMDWYGGGWSTVDVNSMVDAIWASKGNFTSDTLALSIGGTNSSPTGTYGAPSEGTDWRESPPGYWNPLTAKAKIYDLVNDVNSNGFKKWSITYTA